MTRDELSVEAVNAIKTNPNVAIQAGTGVGKSKIAIDMLKSLPNAESILIIVAERAHIQMWKDEFKKWKFHKPVTIACYASLYKYVEDYWDVVIFDEAHHLDTDIRLDLLEKIGMGRCILLSATLKDRFVNTLESYIGKIYSIKCTLQEAIDSNILKEPDIRLIELTLNNKDYNQTIIEGWGKRTNKITCRYLNRWQYLRNKKRLPDTELTIICTEKQKYDYITEQFNYWGRMFRMRRSDIIKNKWLQCGSIRKRFLGELKTDITKQLLEKLVNKRYICFCTSIEQTEALGGKNAIHSKKKDASDILYKFNKGKISNLCAVGMLKEGVNLKDIEVGVIVQLDGEELPFIQKFGRTMRADNPIQYILYYKDTRDEEYLDKALEGINKDYIKVLKV